MNMENSVGKMLETKELTVTDLTKRCTMVTPIMIVEAETDKVLYEGKSMDISRFTRSKKILKYVDMPIVRIQTTAEGVLVICV
jgi:hypothetical protein